MHILRRHGQARRLVSATGAAPWMPAVLRVGGRVPAGWMSRGACRPEAPELFLPVDQAGPAPLERISEAKTVCGRCPVCLSCLSHAVMTRQDGIWGGTTEAERRAMRHSPGRRRRESMADRVSAALAGKAAARHPGAGSGVAW
jgi:WhiB family transcriptional regulator, redox-sensing transcriptional regulator